MAYSSATGVILFVLSVVKWWCKDDVTYLQFLRATAVPAGTAESAY